MSDLLRSVRAAERLLRDPLSAVERVLAAEALPARLTLETDWLNRAPLAGVTVRAGEARSEPAVERGRGRRAALIPPVGRSPTTDRAIAAEGLPRGARTRGAGVPPGGPPTSAAGQGASPMASSFGPPLPMRPAAAETANDRPATRDADGGPVISLRRIGASARMLAAESRQPTPDRVPAPNGPPAQVHRAPGNAPIVDRAASRVESMTPAVTSPDRSGRPGSPSGVAQAPVLGSAMERVSARAEAALARRPAPGAPAGGAHAGAAPSPAPASPEIVRTPTTNPERLGDVAGRRFPSGDGSSLPAPRFSTVLAVEGTRPRPVAAQADPDWVLEVIGEALADQARREGIDLT